MPFRSGNRRGREGERERGGEESLLRSRTSILPFSHSPILPLLIVASLLSATALRAQPAPFQLGEPARDLEPAPGLLSNTVSVLAAQGDSLWAGPYLNLTTDGGRTWLVTDADSLDPDGPNRLFSMDIERAVIWAGLGFSGGLDGSVPAHAGFLASENGGRDFAYRRPSLDALDDTTVVYGVSTLPALPIVQPAQSPPYAIDYDARTGAVWTAVGYAGLRRSTDGGRAWERVVLPPDSLFEIRPDRPHDFRIAPATTAGGDSNYVAYSVLVDETGTVWAGTATGVNRSRPEDVFPSLEARAWQRFEHGTTGGELTGDQVVAIAEHPLPGRNPVWMAAWPLAPDQEFGATFTRDGGQTFAYTLEGERVYGFAFRGETVYAVGDRGLFVLNADGTLRRTVTDFSTPEAPTPPTLRPLSVATTRQALWVGTTAGLYRSTDEGRTWEVFRARPTLEEGEKTYAYPIPFSPSASALGVVSFVVRVDTPREVEIRIYDFGMNLVRRVRGECAPEAGCDLRWDGTDAGGRRVANGVYFYTADTGQQTFRGKIVVLE